MANEIEKYLRKKRIEAINIRVTKEMKEFLEHTAKGMDTSVGDVVIACIKMAFEGKE